MQKTTGTIYGVLLNDRDSLERLGTELDQDPYRSPPKAPVLYIKPANTVVADGALVPIPQTPGVVNIGATIAAVIGRTATAVSRASALAHVAGYRLVADVSLPHGNFFRPAIRERCRDGFCPVGTLVGAAEFDVHQVDISTSVNGQVAQVWTLSNVVRRIDQLICDVSEFMTLSSGDLLLLGLADQQPTARAGDTVSIVAAGFPALTFRLRLDSDQAMQ